MTPEERSTWANTIVTLEEIEEGTIVGAIPMLRAKLSDVIEGIKDRFGEHLVQSELDRINGYEPRPITEEVPEGQMLPVQPQPTSGSYASGVRYHGAPSSLLIPKGHVIQFSNVDATFVCVPA